MVDEDGEDVPDGTPGEIVYRSPQLCEGYWDKPPSGSGSPVIGSFTAAAIDRAAASRTSLVFDAEFTGAG